MTITARDLLDPNRIGDIDLSAGYLDVLPQTAATAPSLSQRAMEHPALAAIYERLWRPTFTRLFSYGGASTATMHDDFLTALTPNPADLVLDVGCGPGLYTRRLAEPLGPDGIAVGLDLSPAMLAKAVRDPAPRTEYVRGDAHALPFPDASFDTVVCLAVLWLIPEPYAVIDELIRVLKPGGSHDHPTLGIFANVASGPAANPALRRVLRSATGLQFFTRDEIRDYLTERGLRHVTRTIAGQGLFVTATTSA